MINMAKSFRNICENDINLWMVLQCFKNIIVKYNAINKRRTVWLLINKNRVWWAKYFEQGTQKDLLGELKER